MDEAREKQEFDVFLSHNSKDKPAVRALAALLTERGISVWFDEEQLIPGRPWQTLLEKGIKESATGAVLVGADGLGPWENEEMQGLLQFAVEEKKPVIPVLLPGAPEKPDLPLFLRNRGWVDLRAGFGTEGMDKLIWGITGEHPSRKPVPPRASEPLIAVTRLRHGADRLVGREKELSRLDTAWHDPKTHVVTIVAWGGVGKTALVVEWMARMARDGWRGAERVFDWSFYSQGTREQGAASADTFIANALEFFGDPEMARSATSPWDKGSRLAQLVAQERTLLVLDGVEPLQYAPGPVGGQIKDPALEALLKGLAQKNPGLCIVTTRESVTDLKPFRDTTSPEWLLEHLSEEAGAHLLFETGVKRAGNAQIRADDKELKDAAHEVGGHALTLQLLGRYLAKVHNGDVRKRDLVRFAKADAKVQGGHAFKVMAIYEKWLLGKGSEDALRQLVVLRLLGLFDRPADAGCITALRQEPVIDGLTESLIDLDNDDWNLTLSNLAECGLISCRESQSEVSNPQSVIDCHPLVREYFGRQLREKNPEVWRSAHHRLYEYLKSTVAHRPEDLDGLELLCRVVTHGCYEGMQQRTFDEIYWERIRRCVEHLSVNDLSRVGVHLNAIARFFDSPWAKVAPSLNKRDQARLLNHAGLFLRLSLRLSEADQALSAGLRLCIEQGYWGPASECAGNLGRVKLVLGELETAIEHAIRSVEYADRSGDDSMRSVWRARLADAMHQAGRLSEAGHVFMQAEQVQTESRPDRPVLHRASGSDYCELLLAKTERMTWQVQLRAPGLPSIGDKQEGTPEHWSHAAPDMAATLLSCSDVERRAREAIRIDNEDNSQFAAALDHHTLGRSVLYAHILGSSTLSTWRFVIDSLNVAVDSLRRAVREDFLPRVLLTRALFQALQDQLDLARADLDEAWRIAERGPMKLLLADIHLYRARLFHGVAPYPWDKDEQGKPRGPKDDLAAARKLIQECSYHRRDEELADAEEAAKSW